MKGLTSQIYTTENLNHLPWKGSFDGTPSFHYKGVYRDSFILLGPYLSVGVLHKAAYTNTP